MYRFDKICFLPCLDLYSLNVFFTNNPDPKLKLTPDPESDLKLMLKPDLDTA
jgi:hypothetical protein